jgi:stalled ribosome rescue protein Dom34
MSKQAGIWIDHREAFIIFVGDAAPKGQQHLMSGMEKHVRYSGHATQEAGTAENQRDRQFATHLEHYYEDVIKLVHDATSLLLLGPGEAKGELKKHLEKKSPRIKVLALETTDKMTQPQISAKVHDYFFRISRGLA